MGAALVALGPHPARPEPDTLSPYSLAAYLRRAAGPGAHDVRVNGVYGSGHYGAWQFAAHLTWRSPDGTVHGGELTLPGLVGAPLLESPFPAARLTREEAIGWSLDVVDRVLDSLPDVAAPLAMLDLEIPPSAPAHATLCQGQVDGPAACVQVDERAHRRRTSRDELVDAPGLDAVSVQRASTPVDP